MENIHVRGVIHTVLCRDVMCIAHAHVIRSLYGQVMLILDGYAKTILDKYLRRILSKNVLYKNIRQI